MGYDHAERVETAATNKNAIVWASAERSHASPKTNPGRYVTKTLVIFFFFHKRHESLLKFKTRHSIAFLKYRWWLLFKTDDDSWGREIRSFGSNDTFRKPTKLTNSCGRKRADTFNVFKSHIAVNCCFVDPKNY